MNNLQMASGQTCRQLAGYRLTCTTIVARSGISVPDNRITLQTNRHNRETSLNRYWQSGRFDAYTFKFAGVGR